MATKKSTSKATKTTKKAAPRKAAPSRKNRTTTKTVTRSKKATSADARSLRLIKDSKPFMSGSFSRETAYWIILGVVVIAFTLWITELQSDINEIYDSIDSSSTIYEPIHVNKERSN